jgi:hypothetical protein
MKGPTMAINLSDTQLIVLSAAAQREDRCLVAPKTLRGGAAQKFAQKLLAAGLVKEIKAKPSAPVWRRDEEAAQPYSLKLTSAGLKAIAVEEQGAAALARTHASPIVAETPEATGKRATPSIPATAQPSRSPREGSKSALVVELVRRDSGATLAELVTATGWLPHTTRAALTGLRKRGYAVTLERPGKARESSYHIPVEPRLAGKDLEAERKKDASHAIAPPVAAPSVDPAARSTEAERLAKPKGTARSSARRAA